jgi:hypothetical protein
MFRFQLVNFGHVATLYFTFVALRKARRYQLPGNPGCGLRSVNASG